MNDKTITLAELAALNCGIFTVKPGDRVYIGNHFAEVVENPVPAGIGTIEAAAAVIRAEPVRTAWLRGVKAYALELLENLAELTAAQLADFTAVRIALLNGAQDWKQYSYGGCSLICDGDIARRCCTPSEYKRSNEGERNPNSRENWLDVQARALSQAARLVCKAVGEVIAWPCCISC